MLGSMIPAQISFGPVSFHMYGLIIGLAIAAAGHLAALVYKRHGGEEKVVWSAFLWAFIGGLIGARLYHVIDWGQYYWQHPQEVIAVWLGGLGIWGAIIGALAAIWLYSLKLKDKQIKWKLLDAMGVAAPLGQAIGRWGNYVNQELYGRQTNFPWGIQIEGLVGNYQPLFLYESFLSLLLLGVLLRLERTRTFKWGKGGYLGSYLLGYGVIRLLMEPLKPQPWTLAGIPTAMVVAVIMAGVGWRLIMKARRADD